MRKRFFRNINANISQVLKGGTLSPGQELITKLSRIQKIRWALGVLSVVLGLGWFTTTDAYARILIAAYEQRIESGEVAADSPTVRFLADQLDSVENLDSLTNDESLKESIAEVAELNLKLNLDDDLQNIDLSGTVDESTTTTLGTTTTTLGTTTTTLGTTTTTLGTTNSVDTDAPTFDRGLTAENITSSTVDISWSATDNIGISYYVLREGSFVIYEGSNTSKKVEGLISSNNYTFSVDAYDNAGNFSTSNVSFMTLSSTTTTTTSTTTTTTIPLAGLCSNENYLQYERLPSDTELLVVWMRVDENCNQNHQPVGGKASAYCFNCGHPFGGSGSNQGVWVWSHMFTADGNHAGIGSGGVFNPVSKIWSFPSSDLSYYQGECNGSNGCDPSDSYSVITTSTTTTTTSTTTTTTSTTTTTTTSTTIPVSITASTVAELVGCVDGSEVGESTVRLLLTNTSSSDAYFDVRYTTDSGSTWTTLSDGEFISSSAAYMFLTPSFENNTTVQWQWRGALTNPSSGSYNYGSSITVSGCSVTTTTTSTTTTVPSTPSLLSFTQESTSNNGGCFAYEASGTDAHKYNWKVNGSQVLEGQVGTFDMADNYHKGTYCVTGQGSGVSVTVEFNFFLFDGTLVSSQSVTFTTN
jgi:hypothetical protein